MSDLILDILHVQRAEVPLVQPRVPSLFEATPAPMGASELEASTENAAPRPSRPEQPSPRAPTEPYRGKLTVDPPPSVPNTASLAPKSDAEQQAQVVHTASETADAPSIPRAPNVIAPETVRVVQAPPLPVVQAAALPTVNPLLPAPPLPTVRPLIESDGAWEWDAQPAPPPTVHVHIGRITVRAVQAPVSKPKAEPAPADKMSLDEYLKSRDRGAR